MIMLTAPQNWPFGAALAVLVGLTVLEGVGLLVAQSPSQWLDHLIPEIPDDAGGFLGWMHVGKVPVLVLLILFLVGFALAGYMVQSVAIAITGGLAPAWLASIPAVFAGMSTVKALGAVLEKIMPKEETVAVSEMSLIGRAGVIVRGHARKGMAAEAKVRDANGRVHYVMVEPDDDTQVFNEGLAVLLVRKVGARFLTIPNPHPELL